MPQTCVFLLTEPVLSLSTSAGLGSEACALYSVRFSGNTAIGEAVDALAAALASSPLQSLSLQRCELSDEAGAKLGTL